MHALLLALSLAAPARGSSYEGARQSGYGLGLILGEPTGVSLKRYLPGGGWDLYIGFAASPGIRFGGDWLWTLGSIARSPDVAVDGYVGVGPFLGTDDSGPCGAGFLGNGCNGTFYFGGRVPFGVEAIFRRAPVSLGFEIAPALGIAPAGPTHAGIFLDILLAVRFLF